MTLHMIRRLSVAAVLLAALLVPGVARAATQRYVALTGTDAGNNCTSAASPCRTITRAATVAANQDVINVSQGTFTENITIPVTASSAHTLSIFGASTGNGTTISGRQTNNSVFILQSNAIVVLNRMTISDGGAVATGGGGVSNQGTAALRNVTVRDNHPGLELGFGEGGGVDNASGATMTISDSTIANNGAHGLGSQGGGIRNQGTLTVTDSTIANNGATVGGGVSGPGTYKGTILSGNTNSNCDTPVTDGGHNIASDASCGFTAGTSRNSSDPQLGALQYNGGPTQTMALSSTSPAVDANLPTCTPNSDQRFVPRPQGAACDIGASERAPGVVTSVVPGSGPAPGGNAVTINGHGFTYTTSITFGPNASPTYAVKSDAKIFAIVPAGTGTVPVTVTTTDGSGATGTYTYTATTHATTLIADPVIARTSASGTQFFYDEHVTLTDAVMNQPLAGQTVTIKAGSTVLCAPVTRADGTANCGTNQALYQAVLNNGYTATFAGAPGFAQSSASAGLLEND